ncbi:ribosome small subunit-dependent GTPase A [Ascidiaceihabitans sp.]|uniref:ribosome small subunit-dependent GTPase A n=1 Tax=Ascidiaceihabitans sp. TaxID=1872644 RepID=UPI003297CBE0
MTRDYSQFMPQAEQTEVALSTLDTLGWQPFFSQQLSIDDMTNTPPVRVTEVHRTVMRVIGQGIDKTIPSVADATVGDWLLLSADGTYSDTVLNRKSLMKRRAPGSDRAVQYIAANIDTAFIVTSCNQDFNVARLERYIAVAFEAEIDPVIVLTKRDLVADTTDFEAQARSISDLVPVIAIDARSDEPKAKLAEWCKPRRTVAFLGSSGVGKSTLANTMADRDIIATQGIRAADDKGRHTTTSRQLHLVPGGFAVLDTPGMRELQMTDVTAGIEDLFSDLQELSTQCKFRDCAHETEPGCAVRAAMDAGDIDEARMRRWKKLVAEDAYNSATLIQRRARDKAFGKLVRGVVKEKKR